MKLKEAIKKVKYLNKWRRGGKGEMPDPIESGIAIDTVLNGLKQKDKQIQELKKEYNRQTKELADYYELTEKGIKQLKECKKEKKNSDDLVNAGIGELKFEKMQVDLLLNGLEEIKSITNDKLVKGIIDNLIERHNLDKMCHTRALFD